jgi:DNA-3-methyladenine glycosylase I
MKKRCAWAEGDDESYLRYHDEEWGVPVHNDHTLFEFLVLESAQAGLSWRTILNKRKGYKKCFKGFDPKKVAKMTPADIETLMGDPSIVRNRLKITATIHNAQKFLEVAKEFGSFSNYIWSWTEGKPIQNRWKHMSDVPGVTELSERISKDLKKRGFKFLGPTVCYAYLQATGVVNDHTTDCYRHAHV